MKITKINKLIFPALIFLISSCGTADIEQKYPNNPEDNMKSRTGKMFGNIKLFDNREQEQSEQKHLSRQQIAEELQYAQYKTLDISIPLWKASIEVMSAKMPIVLIERHAGLIVTDWGNYTGSESNSRYKVNVLVKGREISEKDLMISVFKQEFYTGEWKNSVPEKELELRIKNDILIKARSFK